MMKEKKFKKVAGEKSKELSSMMNTFSKTKSIYARDLEDLLKPPYERASPTKF